MISVLLWIGTAVGSPSIVIEAAMDEDLRTITGTMTMSQPMELVDPLAALPLPIDDRTLLRTFPGAPNAGSIDFEQTGSTVVFTTRLPRRYGDIGSTSHGAFANGGWYPQPLVDGTMPHIDFTVDLTVPKGSVAVVGDIATAHHASWSGFSDRASLAVIPNGIISNVRGHAVISRNRPRKVLLRSLETQLGLIAAEALPFAIVVAPLRRRLVRPGAQLAYLSDRAWRLTPGFERVHHVSVIRGLLTAGVASPSPMRRELAGEALSQAHQAQLAGIGANDLLQKLQWVPQVQWLLSSRTMPFYSDVLELTHPGDRLHDDIAEIFAAYTPGTVVAAQLDDRFGEGTASRVGTAILTGRPVDEAGISETWLDRWNVRYPEQDYRIEVGEKSVLVIRDAPTSAPVETAIIQIDGADHAVTAPSGQTLIELEQTPRKVVLDPQRHLGQTSRLGDSWPRRYTVTFAAWIDSLNLTRLRFEGTGAMTLRRTADTHNLWSARAFTNRTNLVGTRLGYTRKEGPLSDGWSRPHRIGLSSGVSLLNPEFSATNGQFLAVDTGVSYTWDTRISGDFPLRGRRFRVGSGTGFIPGTSERWQSVSTSITGVVSPHPRHALATRISGAKAWSNVPHRLLSLGGGGAMRSIPDLPACPQDDGPCAELASERAVLLTEYRVAPIRNASIPGFLAWGSEFQLSAGPEATVARVAGSPAYALGATVGITGVGEIIGAEPTIMGLTAGWPVWWKGLEQVEHTAIPELYLRWWQAF